MRHVSRTNLTQGPPPQRQGPLSEQAPTRLPYQKVVFVVLHALSVSPDVGWQRPPFIDDALFVFLSRFLGFSAEFACEQVLLAGGGVPCHGTTGQACFPRRNAANPTHKTTSQSPGDSHPEPECLSSNPCGARLDSRAGARPSAQDSSRARGLQRPLVERARNVKGTELPVGAMPFSSAF